MEQDDRQARGLDAQPPAENKGSRARPWTRTVLFSERTFFVARVCASPYWNTARARLRNEGSELVP